MFYRMVFGVGALLLMAVLPGGAEELTIAAAADLNAAFKDIAARYKTETGSVLKIAYGSSGNFFAQISHGAPFDLFFSADTEYPKKLEAAGLVEPGSFYRYARGKLVIWVHKDSPLAIAQGLKILLDPRVKKIAMANPQHAPYGRAAVAALQQEGIYEQVRSKLVFGENVAQAAQFVASRNSQAGIIALSLALAPSCKESGRYFLIAPSSYPAIEQASVILKSSRRKAAARQFIRFLHRSEIKEIMQRYGFAIQEEE